MRPCKYLTGLIFLVACAHGQASSLDAMLGEDGAASSSSYEGVLHLSGTASELSDEYESLAQGYLRAGYTHSFGRRLKMVGHGQVDGARVSSEQMWPLSREEPIQDRYADMTTELKSERLQSAEATVDWLYMQGRWDNGRYAIGRMPITMTYGRIWSPTDTFAPFSYLDLERMYKSGVDAAKLDIYVGRGLNLMTVVSSTQQRANALQSISWSRGGGSVMLNAASRDEQNYISLSLRQNGIAFGGDAYLELLESELSEEEEAIWNTDRAFTGMMGITQKVGDNSLLTVEYLYQSLGADSIEDMAVATERQRRSRLNNLGAARRYVAVALTGQVSSLSTYELLAIHNLPDSGTSLSGLYTYFLTGNLEFRAAFSVPVGDDRENTELGQFPDVARIGLNYYF